MELLIVFALMVVATAVLFWRLTTQRGYRVKNRDAKRLQDRPPSRMGPGPNLSDMLD
ncbi:MAG: hypothetical protein ACFCVK_08730 [Acidimicrobiales bacterium]